MNTPDAAGAAPTGASPAVCARGAARILALAFLVAAALAMVGLWAPPLADSTEARHAEIGREFAEGGDWLAPRLNYRPHLTKPPLTDWLVALGILVFGENEFGARFFNALTAALGVGLAAAFAARLGGRQAGAAAGIFCLVSPAYLALSQTISVDVLLATLAVGGYWAAWEASRPDCPRPRAAGLAFGACLGLGLLAKGHIAFLVLLLPVAVWALAGRRWAAARRLVWPPAIFCALALGVPWFAYTAWRFPGWFADATRKELWMRVVGSERAYVNQGLALLYFAAGALPALPPALFWLLARRARAGAPDTGGGERALLGLWIAIPLAVFAVVRFQRPNYIVPLVPAAAVAAGLAWAGLRQQPGAAGRLGRAAALCVPALALAAAPAAALAAAGVPEAGTAFLAAVWACAAALATCAALALTVMARGGPAAAESALAAAAAALCALALPLHHAAKSGQSAREAVAELHRTAGRDTPLHLHDIYLPSANFYLGGVLESDGSTAPGDLTGAERQEVFDRLWARARERGEAFVLLKERDFVSLHHASSRRRARLRPVWHRGDLMLVRALPPPPPRPRPRPRRRPAASSGLEREGQAAALPERPPEEEPR